MDTGITCYRPRREITPKLAYTMDISEAEHEIPHDFGSIGDAGDTKNLFVDVWTHGSVVRCDSSHVIKKKTLGDPGTT